MENHPQHDLVTVRGYNCCNVGDELSDFMLLFVSFVDEKGIAVGKLLPHDHQNLSATSNAGGDEHFSDPYIPMPIFGGEISEKIVTYQDSPAGPDGISWLSSPLLMTSRQNPLCAAQRNG